MIGCLAGYLLNMDTWDMLPPPHVCDDVCEHASEEEGTC